MEISKEHPYEDACKILGIRPIDNDKSYQLTDETRNFIKLETVAKVLNKGWKPDIMNPEEIRYMIWGWNYTDSRKPSGLLYLYTAYGFSDAAYVYASTSLEFKDAETAKEFARLCKPIIIKHLFGRNDHENFKFNF